MDELIQKARAGDREALNQLLLEVRPWLRDRVDRERSASSLVQLTLLEVWQSFATFRGSTREEFRGWLNRMWPNIAIDQARAAKAQKRGGGQVKSLDAEQPNGSPMRDRLAADHSTPSAAAQRNEQYLHLEQALSELSHEQRVAIRMRHLERRTLAEVAQELDCSYAAAGQYVTRGIQALTKLLSTEEEERP